MVQGNETGFGINQRTRLVKTNVSVTPDAQQLYIQSAKFFYFLFVLFTKIRYLLHEQAPVRNEIMVGRNVHVIEQLFFHKVDITLRAVRSNGIIFVQIRGVQIPERSEERRVGKKCV